MKPKVGSLWKWLKSAEGVTVRVEPSYHSDYVNIRFIDDTPPNQFGLPLYEFLVDFTPLTELEKELL